MVDKPRNPRRNAGGTGNEHGRAPRMGEPGGRPGNPGRTAGKPATGPARPRKATGGYDRRIVEQLEAEGLLSEEGRRFFAAKLGDKKGGAAKERGGRERDRRDQAPDQAEGRGYRGAAPRGEGRLGLPVPGKGGAGAPSRSPFGPMGRPNVRLDRDEERPARGEGRPERRGERPARGPRPQTGEQQRPAKTGRYTKPNAVEALVAERLHKVMAQAGVASRRHSEELIQAGRVTVNGQVVKELGTKIVPGRDMVEVDGRPLGKAEDQIYIMLNKPKGYVTTLYDPQGRPKVTDLLNEEISQRVYPVGRLDYDTEGLLLLTNDGQLANQLMHPAREVKKTYIAKVRGVPGPGKIRQLETGVELDDGMTAPAEVRLIAANGPNAATLSIRIHEGRNRQVRRMCEAIGNEVIHLKRTTLGPLHLKDLPVGQFRELTDREVEELKAATGNKQPVNRAAARGARVAAIVEARKARTKAVRHGEAKEPAGFGAGAEPAAATRGFRPRKPGFPKNRRPR